MKRERSTRKGDPRGVVLSVWVQTQTRKLRRGGLSGPWCVSKGREQDVLGQNKVYTHNSVGVDFFSVVSRLGGWKVVKDGCGGSCPSTNRHVPYRRYLDSTDSTWSPTFQVLKSACVGGPQVQVPEMSVDFTHPVVGRGSGTHGRETVC